MPERHNGYSYSIASFGSKNRYIFDAFFFEDFSIIAVGCFFFISGYGLISSYETKGKAYLTGFPLKRWRKLVIPFLFVIVLFQLINPKTLDILNCFLIDKVNFYYSHDMFPALFYFVFFLVCFLTTNGYYEAPAISSYSMTFLFAPYRALSDSIEAICG